MFTLYILLMVGSSFPRFNVWMLPFIWLLSCVYGHQVMAVFLCKKSFGCFGFGITDCWIYLCCSLRLSLLPGPRARRRVESGASSWELVASECLCCLFPSIFTGSFGLVSQHHVASTICNSLLSLIQFCHLVIFQIPYIKLKFMVMD